MHKTDSNIDTNAPVIRLSFETRQPSCVAEPAVIKAEGKSESSDLCTDSDFEEEDKVDELPNSGVQNNFFDQAISRSNDNMYRTTSDDPKRQSMVKELMMRAS